MKRASLCLLLALACGTGRKPVNEYRIASDPPSSGEGFASALYQSVGAELKPGNSIEVVNNGHVFDAQVNEIGKAQHSIHVVSFIWADGVVSDRLIEAITARTHAGVACRVIVDSVGSMNFGAVQKKLDAAGCETHKFRPLPGQDDLARNHRKILIVDGRVGIAGGFGIDDKWLGNGLKDNPPEWRDSNVLVRGPAVRQMQQAFAENWQEAGGQLLSVSDLPVPDSAGSTTAAFVTSTHHGVATRADRLLQLLIASARKRIWIANAYFVPSRPIVDLLAKKAKAGVDVRILTAGDKTDTKEYLPEQRSRMDELVAAGARGFEYEPVMMHSKTMLVDDTLSVVGSCNLDALSLNEQDEGVVLADDAQLAQALAQIYLTDLMQAKERKK